MKLLPLFFFNYFYLHLQHTGKHYTDLGQLSFTISVLYTLFKGASSLLYGTLECETDSNCLADDAYCDPDTNLCECPLGYTFSTDGSSCLSCKLCFFYSRVLVIFKKFLDVTEYKGECVDDKQCAWLQGKYVCYRGECICESGWRWYQGRCIETKGLNETCSRDLDCYNGYDTFAMSCINGTCQCSEDYYLRGDYDCRPASYSMYIS